MHVFGELAALVGVRAAADLYTLQKQLTGAWCESVPRPRIEKKGENMADRNVEMDTETPEIPEVLESLLVFTLNECKDHILNGAAEEVHPVDAAEAQDTREIILDGSVPFTVLAVKDNLFIETHPGPSPEAVMAAAKHTVEGARGATAYAFCYDGYVETDAGTRDAIIAEGGLPGADEGFAVGYLYRTIGEVKMFEAEPVYIGPAPNFMAGLKDVAEYADEDIDERYLVDVPDDEDLQAAAEGAAEYLAAQANGAPAPTFENPLEGE